MRKCELINLIRNLEDDDEIILQHEDGTFYYFRCDVKPIPYGYGYDKKHVILIE